jgi:hypothetical protein
MVFRLRNDDAINQDAGYFHMSRIERSGRGNTFDLRDDETLAVFGCRRQSQVIQR